MYVFIDDSGDPGFKFDKGSSRFFVIACCVFQTRDSARATALRIQTLRESLGLRAQGEFKFAKERIEIHRQFFGALDPMSFTTRVIIFDKWIVDKNLRFAEHSSLEQYAISRILSDPAMAIRNALVSIDGRHGARYRKLSRTVIRLSGHHPRGISIRKVRFVDSRGNPLIQLADMIAGCAKRSVQDDHKSSAEYRALLSHLLEGVHSSAERIP